MCRVVKYLSLAKEMAESSHHKFRVGAALVRGNRLLSTGTNSYKTDPTMLRYYSRVADWTGLHAEMAAIKGLRPEQIEGSTIFIFRLLRDGTQGLARPCQACCRYLADWGVRRAYFSLDSSGYDTYRVPSS
jgi:deoxycytidylate deaminase